MTSKLLGLATRGAFQTLLQARTLTDPDPNIPAIIYVETGAEDRVISRANFCNQSAAYAAGLQALGVGAGDLVVIAHTQNLESVYAFWGALMIGAIPSMFPTLTEKLDPQIYMQSMAELVRLSGVRVVLTNDDFAPTLAAVVTCPVYGSSQLQALQAESVVSLPTFSPAPESVAFLQHSSGTTGLQKGVALSHTAVLNQLASYSDALKLSPVDVVVSWLPLYHDMGLIAGFLLPLIQGIPLVLMSPFDWVAHPAMLFRALDHYQGTLCWLPNFAYHHCARRIRQRDTEGLDLSHVRAFINCSEPVQAESHALFLERFAANGLNESQLTVSYAMAENVFAVTQSPIGHAPKQDWIDQEALIEQGQAVPVAPGRDGAVVKVSCGAPIAGTQVRVVNAAGESLPERHIGEIALYSDCLLTGYYQREDLNPFTPEGWYLTGDMGYLADGEVYIIGRYKDLIITSGKNVYPQDVEAIVNTVTGVHPGRAVAFGVWDEREGTEAVVVVAEVNADIPPAAYPPLAMRIRQRVAQQSMIALRQVHLVGAGWLVKTSSGKIARAANRDKWQAETQAKP